MSNAGNRDHNGSAGLSDKDKVDVLMRKYALLKQEISVAITNYKAHVKYFQIVFTAMIAIAGFSFSKQSGSVGESRIFWLIYMYAAVTIIAYIVFDVFESQYHMIALGARLASLAVRGKTKKLGHCIGILLGRSLAGSIGFEFV